MERRTERTRRVEDRFICSPHVATMLLFAGWATMYLYVLWQGQTVPETAHLRESWLFPGRPMGEPIDHSDSPDWNVWLAWKSNLTPVFGLMALYLLPGRYFASRGTSARKAYMCLFGAAFVVLMHGVLGALSVALIALLNYLLAKQLSSILLRSRSKNVGGAMLVVWTFNVPVMYWVFRLTAQDGPGTGMRILSLLPDGVRHLPPMLGFEGLGPWHAYRYTCLRLVSFACDALFAHDGCAPAGPKPHPTRSGEPVDDFVERTTYQAQHGLDVFFGFEGVVNYMAYVSYPPLYFVGPILSFNSFVSQVHCPDPHQSSRDLARYAIEIVGYAAILESSLHVLYYPGWLGSEAPIDLLLSLPLSETIVAVHSLLNFEFMSLMVIWRFQRLVTALDKIDVFENMTRNINLVCSFQEMWRVWHVSLNKFAVRYIYVPLGGSKRPLLGVTATFVFVAFWHEVNGAGTAVHWYIWGGLNCLFVVMEKAMNSVWPVKGVVCLPVVSAITYQVMQFANIPAMMDFSISCSLTWRLLSGWKFLITPLLYGLQGVLATQVTQREKERKL